MCRAKGLCGVVKFQGKAKKASARCQSTLEARGGAARARAWRKIFGKHFPRPEAVVVSARLGFDKEQFIEDRYPVDVRYNLELDCEIRTGTSLQDLLRRKLRHQERIPKGRHLRFFVGGCNVPGEYQLFWKVRNRGPEAIERKMLRGEIILDGGSNERRETSDFSGKHYVEAYVVKDGVCVARERIAVPIEP